MRGIILAAGRGSRMGGLTNEKPKCLMELGGMTLLDRQIETLRDAGIEQLAVITGYRKDQLVRQGVEYFHNDDWSDTQMVYSLSCAREWLEQDTCIVSYSDIFYDKRAPEMLMRSDADLAITFDPNWIDLWRQRFEDPLSDAETLVLDEHSNILQIGSKTSDMSLIHGQYMGLIRIAPNGWSFIEEVISGLPAPDFNALSMTELLNLVASEARCPVSAISYDGQWGEVDNANDLGLYKTWFSNASSKV